MLLAVASAGSLEGAEQMAGALQRQGLFYVVGVLSAVVAIMAGALAWSTTARLRDMRKLLTEVLKTVNQNSDAYARFARALEAKWPKSKRPPEEP